METFEIGAIVKLRMAMKQHGLSEGSVGEITGLQQKDTYFVLFVGCTVPTVVFSYFLERLSVYKKQVRKGGIYSLLLGTSSMPAGTVVTVLDIMDDIVTVKLPSSSTMIPWLHLGKASFGARLRHLFTR